MNILVVLVVSLLIALARGGRLSALGECKFNHIWLFFVPFVL